MTPTADAPVPLPIPASYWLVPGRLLVGEYPGSPSRAEAMERLRRFLQAGVTCFVDLTEPRELPSYEALLPFETPDGRRIEYLREPIVDHGVPADRETMQRAIAMLDNALAAGHVVYLHCRAGVGRSATVAGCWLANRSARTSDALDELQRCWRQSARSQQWDEVPETAEQVAYILDWTAGSARQIDVAERARGALLGLAAGDAFGAEQPSGSGVSRDWTQHTALALCLADSLLECGRPDARDQVERYLRWQRDGYLSATGMAPQVTPDVAKALANYRWRRQAMAGSHDPRDRSTAALPRVVSAVLFSFPDPAAAVRLAGECARTTHQSPFVIDACRYYGAMLVGAMRGAVPRAVLEGLYEPGEGFWAAMPLRPAVAATALAAASPRPVEPATAGDAPDAMLAISRVRAAVACASGFDDALRRARDGAVEPALEAALAGTLMGALHGAAAIPRERMSRIARLELIEQFAMRLSQVAAGAPAK